MPNGAMIAIAHEEFQAQPLPSRPPVRAVLAPVSEQILRWCEQELEDYNVAVLELERCTPGQVLDGLGSEEGGNLRKGGFR